MADRTLSDADVARMETPLWEQAKAAVDAGDADGAKALIDRAVTLDPQEALSWYGLALAASLGDALSTVIGVRAYGATEVNPALGAVFASFGVEGAMAVKLVIAVAVMTFSLWRVLSGRARGWALIAGGSLTAMTVAWNAAHLFSVWYVVRGYS